MDRDHSVELLELLGDLLKALQGIAGQLEDLNSHVASVIGVSRNDVDYVRVEGLTDDER